MSDKLETFDNPQKKDDYLIRMEIPEFTCICPLTSQPDFAEFKLEYIPDKLCVELKSLKLYMGLYRDVGAFHEDVTNQIFNDLFSLLKPRCYEIACSLESQRWNNNFCRNQKNKVWMEE